MNRPIVVHSRAPRTRHHGVGLIEVLIAVLILSIGLLGIAFVQTRSLSGNNSSMARSMAVVATYSILDAMRADRANLAAYDGVSVTANSCPTGGSTRAMRQIIAWCTELGARLGAAASTRGEIRCTGSLCTVTITYDDSRIGAAGTSTQTVVTRAML
ncbi:type IV pilus assembly protein PilV [Fontimonas thermophila]|uniref:Type IV pilus assembly protein PilV n=1 Tax=Fontimonas thermophila TaxID=1076937 RepID=A0A1I2KG63_9GAMM|nr:type IV pilus modification protein PilV [Fontimonas thermophila]SFF66025.1 type IV pilus assembly protein PilV [Fontimonas thermophila]